MFGSERRKLTDRLGGEEEADRNQGLGGRWITECSALTSYSFRSDRIGSKMSGKAEETELLTAAATLLTSCNRQPSALNPQPSRSWSGPSAAAVTSLAAPLIKD